MSYAQGPHGATTTNAPGPPRYRLKTTWFGSVVLQVWEPARGFRRGHYRAASASDFADLNWFLCGAWHFNSETIYFGGSADAPG